MKTATGEESISQPNITTSAFGEITRLTVRGRVQLDSENSAGDVWDAVKRCCADCNCREIIIDLGGVVKMDAAGLGVLASGYCAAQKAGARLVLENTPPRIQELLKICRLDRFFPPYAEAISLRQSVGL